MAKRVDNDSTMEVSSSQLVSGGEKRPAPHQAPGVSKNDVSMWIGGVVGLDEFSGAGKRPRKRSKALIVVLLALVVAAGGGVGYYLFSRGNGTAATAKPAAVLPDAGAMAAAPPLADAMTDAAPLDAMADATPADAAIGDAAIKADAVSGVDATAKPPVKKTKKKIVRKKVLKPAVKKPATHHK